MIIFEKGVRKANSIELLPPQIGRIYNSVWVRILRAIGGISTAIVLTKLYKHINLPEILIYLLYYSTYTPIPINSDECVNYMLYY